MDGSMDSTEIAFLWLVIFGVLVLFAFVVYLLCRSEKSAILNCIGGNWIQICLPDVLFKCLRGNISALEIVFKCNVNSLKSYSPLKLSIAYGDAQKNGP